MSDMTDIVKPSFAADEHDAANVARQVAVLDIQARVPGVTRLRSWVLDALELQAGERVLDVGSGTGDQTRTLAEVVGAQGEAVGVEPNSGLRAEAERRASGMAARFVDGRAAALPFADGSVDAVVCERVFQHLDDPQAAAAEIARALRPGGRVVVTDSDWATAIFQPVDQVVETALAEVMRAWMPNSLSGRRLPGQLTAAGLVVADIGSQAIVLPPEEAIGPLITIIAGVAVDRGLLTAEQRDTFLAGLEAGAERGDFLMSVTMFAVLARKP